MATRIDPIADQGKRPVVTAGRAPATPAPVTTTLYDLIATMQDLVGPGHDRLVVATVAHRLAPGAITLPRALALQRGEPLAGMLPSGPGRP